MAFSRCLTILFSVVVILGYLEQSDGIECFHCSYFEQTRIEDGYKLVANNLKDKRVRMPTDRHPSCAQGQVPSESLLVDCDFDYYAVLAKTFKDHPDPQNQFEDIEEKVERHIQATKGATMGCATVFVNGEWTVKGMTFKVENAYRSCYPNSTSFTTLLSQFKTKFPEMAITGYSCDHEAKCNGYDFNDHDSSAFASSGACACVCTFLCCIMVGLLVFLVYFGMRGLSSASGIGAMGGLG